MSDLRDRIAKALGSVDRHRTMSLHLLGRQAAAVMAVVQPELDQHWADLACRTNERDQWREEARRMTENRDYWRDQVAKEWRQRAEAAEAALATQNAENDRLDQLLIDERATTARLGRELAQLRDQNGHHT